MVTQKLKLITLCLLLFTTVGLFAQGLQPLPIDPAVRYGKLENGLTYYIRHNENPKERAEFYIAQNVGAIMENDDQDGLAHFLEHMAFNGTKNFPDKKLIEYFESKGVRFGYNINAYTALDETVYNLSNVPTNDPEIINKALLALHDWSSFIALEGEEIDAERGVILEEWRTGQGANRRMWKETNRMKYPNSQYAVRDVIGDTAVINNFDHKVIRDFYHKWYRPDLQSILVVGDIDVDAIENKIKEMFADIPRKENFGERPIYPIHDNEEPIVAIATDPEARYTTMFLEYKHDVMPAEVKLSINGYLVNTVSSLVTTMLANRFSEMTQQADAPFMAAYALNGSLVKSKDAFRLIAIPHEGRETEGFRALALQGEKMRRYGFTVSEFDRAKTDLLKTMEKAYNERENQKNNDLVREYVRHYLDNEPIPGIEFEYQTLQFLLPQLTVDMANELAASYITDNNVLITINAPEKVKSTLPTVEQLISIMSEVKTAEIAAPVEEDLNKPLVAQAPKAGKIKSIKQNAEIGTTEWTLSNGVKVIIKPTAFKQDEILMTAYSQGGFSKVNNVEDLPSAVFATTVIESNGLGEFTATDLQKILTGKIAEVSPDIDNYTEGLTGHSSVADFKEMMQLTYLYFTAPRKDDNAYQAMVNMFRTAFANMGSDPRKVFSDSISTTLSNHNPRAILEDMSTLEKVNQDKAIAIYKERFANPADFTFIFVGNIDPNSKETQELVTTYLGGLKTTKKTEKYTDRGIRRPEGKVNNYFAKDMQVKKSSNLIVYSAEIPFNQTNRINVTTIGNILSSRYLESIREKEGGSYGVAVRGSLNNVPVNQATLMMQFDTDPEKQAKLMKIIHAEIDEIIANGPKEEDLHKVKEGMLKQHAVDLAENSWWRSALVLFYQDGINLPKEYKPSVEALSKTSVQSTLKEISKQGNVIEVVMKPAE